MVNFEDIYDTSELDKEVNHIKEKSILQQEPITEDDGFEEINYTEDEVNEFNAEQLAAAQKELYEFNQAEHKSFDDIVSKYLPLIGLKGESYISASKILFYTILGNQLKTNMFTFDNKLLDLRLSALIQLKAGHGKKNYETFIKRTIEGCGKDYQEPVSYHPEQFVGKIIVDTGKKGEEPTYTPIIGTLGADFLVIDEAHALLSNPVNETCLQYLRTALDPIGSNTIEKKQVNVPNEWKLKYNPMCSVILLTQPITNINEELLVRGSFRRFVILFINVPEGERLEALESCTFLTKKQDVYNKMWDNWIEFNKSLFEYKNLIYACSQEDMKLIDEYIKDVKLKIEKSGQEVNEFYWTILFTMKINIFKMAIIRAIIGQQKRINTITILNTHIQQSILDWDCIWQPQVQWIARQLQIQSLKPIGWNDKIHEPIWKIINILYKGKQFTFAELKVSYKNENKNFSDNSINNNVRRALQDFSRWGNLEKTGTGKKGGYTYSIKSKER